MSAVMDNWLPRHRFTVDEYYRMAEVGLLDPEARVELIEGEVIDMQPPGTAPLGGSPAFKRKLCSRRSGSSRKRYARSNRPRSEKATGSGEPPRAEKAARSRRRCGGSRRRPGVMPGEQGCTPPCSEGRGGRESRRRPWMPSVSRALLAAQASPAHRRPGASPRGGRLCDARVAPCGARVRLFTAKYWRVTPSAFVGRLAFTSRAARDPL